MKPRVWPLLVPLFAMIQTDCMVCGEYPCSDTFSLVDWCITSKKCRVNGELITDCECCGKTPDCPLLNVREDSRIEIPFDEVWPLVGQRNDLGLFYDSDFGRSENIELFLDGVPPPDGTCVPSDGMYSGELWCRNLPPTLHWLEFHYKKEPASGSKAPIQIELGDKECFDSTPACGT